MSDVQTAALQRALSKFTLKEVARTGRISLKRGDALLEMGGWGDGFRAAQVSKGDNENDSPPAPLESVDGDVYMADSKGGHGEWVDL